ncbi:hypothetical protein [Nocardioides caldifontis]|uniref:hypothetical protein n=1 Tax=Nocardioides caldifontis TaxID=2588938 RepID=UPI0011E03A0A|nr:hypothetical protein [Nocardioides caldifontis]
MTKQLSRALVTATLAAAVLGGTTTTAHADVADGCEGVGAALTVAQAEETAAKRAFTTFTRSQAHEQVALLKATERREAREAARAEQRAAREVAKGLDKSARKEALAALKEARRVARQEAKEAREVARADRKALKALVKAERKELKAAWKAAAEKADELEALAEECADAPVVTGPSDDAPQG